MKGTSTCNCPKFPNNKKLNTNKQKKNLDKILNELPLTIDLSVIGNINNINKAENIAITPPNLSGIDLNIAQNGNKYHSGTIEGGVTIGLPGIQLSACPNVLGEKNTNKLKNNINTKTVIKSLNK